MKNIKVQLAHTLYLSAENDPTGILLFDMIIYMLRKC